MPDRILASFCIDITSVREHTWQGRVRCGDQLRTFESELQLLRHMIELAPSLTPDISRGRQEQDEKNTETEGV